MSRIVWPSFTKELLNLTSTIPTLSLHSTRTNLNHIKKGILLKRLVTFKLRYFLSKLNEIQIFHRIDKRFEMELKDGKRWDTRWGLSIPAELNEECFSFSLDQEPKDFEKAAFGFTVGPPLQPYVIQRCPWHFILAFNHSNIT